MADTHMVTAKLAFLLDKEALNNALKGADKFKAELGKLEKQAQELKLAIQGAYEVGSGGLAEQWAKELDKVKSKMVEVQRGAKKALAEEYVSSVRKASEQSKQLGEQIGQVSTRITAVGAGIGAAFYQASQKYAQGVGQNEVAGRAWLATTKRIEDAQISLGREASKALEPWMENLAGISEWAADFARKNPGGVQGLLLGGVGLAAVGGLGLLFAEGIKITADLKMITASAMMNTAADKMLAAAGIQSGASGTGAAASVAKGAGTAGLLGIAGVIGGLAMKGTWDATNAITKPLFNFDKNQALAVGAYGIGSGVGRLLGDETLAKEWFTAVAGWTGVIDANTQAQMENTLAQKQLAAAASETAHVIHPETWTTAQGLFSKYQGSLDAAGLNYSADTGSEDTTYYADVKAKNDAYYAEVAQSDEEFQDWQRQAQAKFDDQQKQETLDFQAGQVKDYETHAKGLSKSAEQFYREESRAETTYYARRLEAAQKFGEETARMEEDHQTQMRRMSEDNSVELDDLARSRDALGYVKALRRQERERQRAEEDYQKEAARKNADFARQLADGEKQFAEERAARLDDYAQRLKDAQDAYAEQAAITQAEFKKQQDAAKANFAQQFIDANTAHSRREYQRRQQHEAEMTQLAVNHRDKLGKLKTQFETEKTQLKNQLVEALNALDPYILGQEKKVKADLEKNATEFGKFVAGMRAQLNGGKGYTATGLTDAERKALGLSTISGWSDVGASRGRAAGGYADFGKYLLGEGGWAEFVLNGQSTRAAEQLIGGRLSQENLIGGLISSRSGGTAVHIGGIAVNGTDVESAARLAGQMVEQKIIAAVRRQKRQV